MGRDFRVHVGLLGLQHGHAALYRDLLVRRADRQLEVLRVHLADDHRDVRLLERPEPGRRGFDGIRPLRQVQESVDAAGVGGRLPFQSGRIVGQGYLHRGHYGAGLVHNRTGDRPVEHLGVDGLQEDGDTKARRQNE